MRSPLLQPVAVIPRALRTAPVLTKKKTPGPKKEEKMLFAIGRPESEKQIRVPPLAGRLSRQKEITEPFVLTVAKPLPQKKEREKKMLCTAR